MKKFNENEIIERLKMLQEREEKSNHQGYSFALKEAIELMNELKKENEFLKERENRLQKIEQYLIGKEN